MIEPHVIDAFLTAAGHVSAQADAADNALTAARDALSAAEADLTAYRDNTRIVGVIGPDSFVEGLQNRADAVERAQRELAQATARAEASGLTGRADLAASWPDLTVGERKQLLAAAFDTVVIRPGRASRSTGARSSSPPEKRPPTSPPPDAASASARCSTSSTVRQSRPSRRRRTFTNARSTLRRASGGRSSPDVNGHRQNVSEPVTTVPRRRRVPCTRHLRRCR